MVHLKRLYSRLDESRLCTPLDTAKSQPENSRRQISGALGGRRKYATAAEGPNDSLVGYICDDSLHFLSLGVFRVLLHGERSGKWSESTHGTRTGCGAKEKSLPFDFGNRRSVALDLSCCWSNYAPAARLFALGRIYIPSFNSDSSAAKEATFDAQPITSQKERERCLLNRKRDGEKIQSDSCSEVVIQSFVWCTRVVPKKMRAE